MSGNSEFPGDVPARDAGDSSLSPQEAAHFEKLLHLFCANRRGTHGCAESSIKLYRGILLRAVRDIGLPPWAWRPQDIDLLLSAYAKKGLSSGTQLGTITVLRGLQNYLLEDLGLCNEIQQLFGFRPQRFITSENSIPYRRKGRKRSKSITPLTKKQCTLLLDEYQFQIDIATQRRSKSYNTLRRDYAITVLALSYGLRVEELLGIEIPHFMSDRKYPAYGQFALLHVIGKGLKERVVRLYAPDAADVLQWYIDHVRAAFLTENTENPNLLFLSERGGALCHRQYRRSLASTAAAAGLSVHVHPHLLRHTYATLMAQSIGPAALQRQLGHEHLSTTLGTYYHQDPERVGDEVRQGVEAMMDTFEGITKDAANANLR